MCILIGSIIYHNCINDLLLTFIEVEKLKGMSSVWNEVNGTGCQSESLSHDLKKASQEAAQAQENLKVTCLNQYLSLFLII